MGPIGFNQGVWAAHRSFYQAERAVNTALERLATGTRINRASDDPAGALAVENFDAKIVSLEKQIASIERTNLALAAKEGAISVVADLAIELKGLVVTAANRDALSDGELESMQEQAESILGAIDFLANTTTYDGVQTITSLNSISLGAVSRIIEDEAGEPIESRFSLADLGIGGALNLVDGDHKLALESVDKAVESLSHHRAQIGSAMKQNDHRHAALMVEYENTMGARSLIRDTDYARETAELTRARVLQQASMHVAMIAQQQQASVLALLQPIG